MRMTPVAATVGAVALGLAGCTSAATDDTSKITVTAGDTACDLSTTSAAAGVQTFAVTNTGTAVTEFYVFATGDRVMGEVENIAPGLTRELVIELAAGAYETSCRPGMTGDGIRAAFTVSGSAALLTEDARLAEATAGYQRYVRSQTAALLEKTQEFVDAVKAGDVAAAKALYPVARTYWERIEPVAEIFGDLDPRIDGRVEVVEEGMEFTGFHRLERDLWEAGDISASGPTADRLMADITEIVALADAEQLSPLQLANGAKELLDEVATGKITGEENRYSHTDLWDFAANVEGARAAVQALRPVLTDRAPDLVAELDDAFAGVEQALEQHRTDAGWRLHTDLSQAQLKELSDAINALSEPISEVAAVVAR